MMVVRVSMDVAISIHALLAESDSEYANVKTLLFDFYPRSPCGERPTSFGPIKMAAFISIHALLAESDPATTGKQPAVR